MVIKISEVLILKIRVFSIILLISISFAICFSGCLLLGPQRIPEENLIIYSSFDFSIYEYYEKTAVYISYEHDQGQFDQLLVRTDVDSDSWINFDNYILLEGKFEKVGWYDDKLFILMDDIYYAFDIAKYEIGTSFGDIELKEYTENEIKQLYSDYELFDWYGH